MAQRRSKRNSFPTAKDFQGLVETDYTDFEAKSQREKYIAETYKELHESLASSNEKRVFWIQWSMRVFFITLGGCIAAFIIGLFMLFG